MLDEANPAKRYEIFVNHNWPCFLVRGFGFCARRIIARANHRLLAGRRPVACMFQRCASARGTLRGRSETNSIWQPRVISRRCLVAVDSGPAVVSRKAARVTGRTVLQRNAIVIDRFFESRETALAWERSYPHFMTVRIAQPDSREKQKW